MAEKLSGLLSCVLLYYNSYQVLSGHSHLTWVNITPLNNKLKQGGYAVHSRSGIECGKMCSSDITCASFFFAHIRVPNCHLHMGVYNNMTKDLVDAPSASYYILDAGTTTTTVTTPSTTTTTRTTSRSTSKVTSTTAATSTTTPSTTTTSISTSPCPSDFSDYNAVILDDGSTYTYRIKSEPETQPGAKSSCEAEGAFLTRVTTISKMRFLLDLVNCPDVNNGQDFYVDGSNAGAANYFAIDAWKMANGDQVPMTNDFWGPTFPDNAGVDHCLRMKRFAGYMLDDCNCLVSRYSYICEK